jgi:hypothetical protein
LLLLGLQLPDSLFERFDALGDLGGHGSLLESAEKSASIEQPARVRAGRVSGRSGQKERVSGACRRAGTKRIFPPQRTRRAHLCKHLAALGFACAQGIGLAASPPGPPPASPVRRSRAAWGRSEWFARLLRTDGAGRRAQESMRALSPDSGRQRTASGGAGTRKVARWSTSHTVTAVR